MKCMQCNDGHTSVVQTIAYETAEGPAVLRHRKCKSCGVRVQTDERVKKVSTRSPANVK
jgi:transcriptional regulator NrdR family protein